jgi:hypothetical protein
MRFTPLACLILGITACGPPTSDFQSRRDTGLSVSDGGGSQADAGGNPTDTGSNVHPEIVNRCAQIVAGIQANCPNDLDAFTVFCQQEMLFEQNGQALAVYSPAAINACMTTYLTDCDLAGFRTCLATFP